ncbi:MAG: TonB family protein [Elusimicrobiota bacterium]
MFSKRAIKRDLIGLLVACILHGCVLISDPSVRWGLSAGSADEALPIEFVGAQEVSALLAPVPPGGGTGDVMPAHGPGEYQPEQSKAGSPEAPKADAPQVQDLPKPKTRKDIPDALKRRMRRAAALPGSLKAKLERERFERRVRREEAAKLLAMLPSPDEELVDSPNSGPALSVSAAKPQELALTGAEGGAVPAGDADPVYDIEGKEGLDERTVRPAGGGTPNEGGGVDWSLDGPAGNRRLVRRAVPPCPAWVSERSLDLSVQVKFQVLEDGKIKRGRVIRKTSGFPDIDRLAMEALDKWLFEAIPEKAADRTPDTWGIVTFRFTVE